MRLLDERTESVRDLEPTLVIYSCGVIAPEHGYLLHFAPQNSTAIVEAVFCSVNAKMLGHLGLRLIFAPFRVLRCADLSCSEPDSLDFPHRVRPPDRKSTRLNSSHTVISYA